MVPTATAATDDDSVAAAVRRRRARTAAVRRPHGGCRVRSGQRGCRGRHRVHDRRRSRVQRDRLFSRTVRVVAPVIVTVVTVVRRDDRHEPFRRYMVSGKYRNTVLVVVVVAKTGTGGKYGGRSTVNVYARPG